MRTFAPLDCSDRSTVGSTAARSARTREAAVREATEGRRREPTRHILAISTWGKRSASRLNELFDLNELCDRQLNEAYMYDTRKNVQAARHTECQLYCRIRLPHLRGSLSQPELVRGDACC
mmetsp:Transcript_28797/g.83542  ORF Transcript_28797/g.83542 Transcript_28797/m.83542 type:complete len:121 (+) Transcript_28797:251-613(+)